MLNKIIPLIISAMTKCATSKFHVYIVPCTDNDITR